MIAETHRIELRPETSHMTILAGGSAEQQIVLVNNTVLPDEFEISLEGLPENWYTFSTKKVNLFPNWSDSIKLSINLSPSVRPNLYVGRIIAVSKTQPSLRTEFRLEIQVLAPLKVDARLDPRRATGHHATYNVILRNRSMCEGLMSLHLIDNEFCQAHFSQPQIRIGAGQTQTVKMKVQLRPKTPDEQAHLSQAFKVQVVPQWFVQQVPTPGTEVTLEGEYTHATRWGFLLRHPRLYIFLLAVLLLLAIWIWLLLPAVQGAFLLIVDNAPPFSGTPHNAIRVEQVTFNQSIHDSNPLGAFADVEVEFEEEDQAVVVKLKYLSISINLKGHLTLDPKTSDLKFVSDPPDQVNTFPWFFMPPNKAVDHFNQKLKRWLADQPARQKITDKRIEGNTLFLYLQPCAVGDPACSP